MWDPNPWTTPRSSYPQPVTAPTAGPCDPPLVCVEINAEYIPFIAGAMSQLTQRVAWKAASEDDLQQILANMTWAVELVGTAVQCSQPPMIPGQPNTQRCCNIAGYLANYVIRESFSQAINAVNNEITAVSFVWAIMAFIPGFAAAFPILTAAFPPLLNAIRTEGTADYQAAITDPVLFGRVACAFYEAILPDGQVTAANFPTIVANITAISFASSNVKTTLLNFVNDLGAAGMMALQVAGPLQDYDCSACGGTGPALGPVGPPPTLVAGKIALQIGIGAADALLPVLFPKPFPSPPLLTAGVDNELVVPNFLNITTMGFDARITAAAPALATMSATLDYTAQLPEAT